MSRDWNFRHVQQLKWRTVFEDEEVRCFPVMRFLERGEQPVARHVLAYLLKSFIEDLKFEFLSRIRHKFENILLFGALSLPAD